MKCAWKGCPDDAPERGNFCAAHLPGDPRNWTKRVGDNGWLCRSALRAGQFWDFIDKRDIDKHAMSWAVFAVTCYIVFWILEFIWDHPARSGIDIGAVIAALMVPWSPVLAAVIKWYFDARPKGGA